MERCLLSMDGKGDRDRHPSTCHAPVGMTNLLHKKSLSSRPERSEVEGPAVLFLLDLPDVYAVGWQFD